MTTIPTPIRRAPRPSRAVRSALLAALATAVPTTLAAAPINTAFTYQGQLSRNGGAVNGTCNFLFGLYTAPIEGVQLGGPQGQANVVVTNGLFTVKLDFGDQFSGEMRWLQSAVQCAGDAGYTSLLPRQELTATPYALSLRPGSTVSGPVAGGGAALVGQNTSPDDLGKGLWGRADASGASGVYGSSTAGHGVHGFSLAGVAMFAEGNAVQSRERGGWVKAMAHVGADATIARCYNGVTGASSDGCGFSASKTADGRYTLDFGFQVDDRFVSGLAIDSTAQGGCLTPHLSLVSLSANTAAVATVCSGTPHDGPFHILVY